MPRAVHQKQRYTAEGSQGCLGCIHRENGVDVKRNGYGHGMWTGRRDVGYSLSFFEK